MDRKMLNVIMWVLFLGGLFGLGAGMVTLFNGSDPAVYGVLGIGGGFWLLSSAITILIRENIIR